MVMLSKSGACCCLSPTGRIACYVDGVCLNEAVACFAELRHAEESELLEPSIGAGEKSLAQGGGTLRPGLFRQMIFRADL